MKTKTRTKRKIEDVSDYVLSLFFPNRCKFCGKLTDAYNDICDECKTNLPWIDGDICIQCGSKKEDCGCKKQRGHFYDMVVAPLYFEDAARESILKYKFYNEKLNYKCYAKLMSDVCKARYSDIEFDYITYIPMDKESQRKRGYNQSYLLAKRVSENLNIPLANNMIVKKYKNATQHNCTAIERKGNIFGIFDVSSQYNVVDKNILIIDDIKTSGCTLSECGKMLYLYGAKSVNCLTAALIKSKIKE